MAGKKNPNISRGTMAATACPWCRTPQDFRDLEDYGMEKGNILTCDKCDKNYKIKALRTVKVVYLERTTEKGNLYGD